MQKKKCSKCGEFKSLSEFYKNRTTKDKFDYYCKSCVNKSRKTKSGLITRIYDSQKSSSKLRGQNPPDYDKKTFIKWILKQPMFEKLFINWKDSNYDKMLRPSIDRKKDNLSYTIDNIQLMTWKENDDKANDDKRSGKLHIKHKPVIQYDKKGNKIAEYISTREANRMTGIYHISATCRGVRKTAGGYKWKFK